MTARMRAVQVIQIYTQGSRMLFIKHNIQNSDSQLEMPGNIGFQELASFSYVCRYCGI